jgi:hypothetical protein
MNGEPTLFDDDSTSPAETTEDREPETDVHLQASADGRIL